LKLDVSNAAKVTGIAESTVRQYAWQKALGKTEGEYKVFTIAEAENLNVARGGPKRMKKIKSSSTTKSRVGLLSRNVTLAIIRRKLQRANGSRPSRDVVSSGISYGLVGNGRHLP